MTDDFRFRPLFERLRSILQEYEPHLMLKINTDNNYYLVAPHSPKWKSEVMFGAVQIKKNYVTYYLMPLYMYPELVQGMSRLLKKRMHGKSCFNFKRMERDDLYVELAGYTERGFERFRVENLP